MNGSGFTAKHRRDGRLAAALEIGVAATALLCFGCASMYLLGLAQETLLGNELVRATVSGWADLLDGVWHRLAGVFLKGVEDKDG